MKLGTNCSVIVPSLTIFSYMMVPRANVFRSLIYLISACDRKGRCTAWAMQFWGKCILILQCWLMRDFPVEATLPGYFCCTLIHGYVFRHGRRELWVLAVLTSRVLVSVHANFVACCCAASVHTFCSICVHRGCEWLWSEGSRSTEVESEMHCSLQESDYALQVNELQSCWLVH